MAFNAPGHTAAPAAPAASWMKTGNESEQLAKNDQVQYELRKAEMGKMFRFFLAKNEEARVTFVDGQLSPQGFLVPPRFYEHTIMMNNQWTNYVCPEHTNPAAKDKCPICESGDRPSLVGVFTVIDHRVFKSTKTAGKEYSNTPKLFVAKSGTLELLQALAVKRGGLAGVTWDAMRKGDKAPAVGSAFDFIEKGDVEALKAKFMHEVVNAVNNTKTVQTFFVPANYEAEIVYRTGDQLRAMGIGPSMAPAGGSFGGGSYTPPAQNPAAPQSSSYAENL
jgi:hypothetical protein